jgi:hypothetical protein
VTVPVVSVPAGDPSTAGRRHAHERGDIIGSWLIKVTIGLGLLGIVCFDGLSIVSTQMTLTDQVSGAAREAVDAMAGGDAGTALPAAEAYARDQNSSNVVAPADVLVGSDGSATVTVHRTATTVVLFRLGPLADWADRTATHTAVPLR